MLLTLYLFHTDSSSHFLRVWLKWSWEESGRLYFLCCEAWRGSSCTQQTGTADKEITGTRASQHKHHMDKKRFGYLQLLIFFLFQRIDWENGWLWDYLELIELSLQAESRRYCGRKKEREMPKIWKSTGMFGYKDEKSLWKAHRATFHGKSSSK